MDKGEPTIYIDVTETLGNKLNTGIQRVVRNISSRKNILEELTGHKCFLVYVRYESFFLLEGTANLSEVADGNMQGSAKHLEVSRYEWIINTIIAKAPFIKPVYGVLLSIRRFLKENIFPSTNKEIKFKKGDALILLDSFWNRTTLNAVEKMRDGEAKVVSVIYDIIPILYPEFVQKDYAEAFPGLLRRALLLSDGVMTLSNSSKMEIEAYISKFSEFEHLVNKIDFFHLGSDFHSADSLEGQINASTQRYLDRIFDGPTKTYLMVGTIEPRKGHKYVLECFKQYWASGGSSKLLIVGKYGWMFDDIKEAIENCDEFDKNLFVLNRISDPELAKIYELSDALIMGSYTEGFGLPLVEAIQFGKVVLASDIPVFKEIGKSYPEYFSLHDKSSLVKLLMNEKFEKNVDSSGQGKFHWPSWDETAEVFYTRSLKLIDK